MSHESWVNDQLHQLVGFADSQTVNFVIALGRRASSASGLLDTLSSMADLPNTPHARTFANELFSKLGTAPRAVSSKMKEEERAATVLARQNASFNFIEMEDPGSVKSKKEEKGRKRHMRKRKHSVLEEADEEDDRTKDQRLKMEFEDRLRKRDETSTKKVVGGTLSKTAEEEVKKRMRLGELKDKEEREKTVMRLRETARREYLKMREPQKVQELREALDDDRFLFKGERLTETEKKIADLNKGLYDVALQSRDAANVEYDGYQIPQGEFDERGRLDKKARWEKLTKRYTRQEEEKNTHMNVEQNEWEMEQIGKNQMTYGAKKKSRKKKSAGIEMKKGDAQSEEEEENFDYVFEDQIDFLKEEILAGKDVEALPEVDHVKAAQEAAKKTMEETRKSLPIYGYRDGFLEALEKYQVLVVVGETGSGKTTQIPQYLHEHGYTKRGKVGCTQPRRVAAMSVAKRVADEMGVRLGYEVGYSIRFEDCTSEKTVLKYMTDGMLLREFLSEPDLRSYSVLIIDEAHERTLHTDILFGLVKDVSRFRPDLKLIISSATLDSEKFSKYFDDAPVYKIPGRRYPVDLMYTRAPEADYIDAAVVTTLQIHITQPPGDILIFLTGQEEVDTTAELLATRTRGLGNKISELIVCRIYATLPSDLQAKIFEPTPPGARKVVVATNIAETSLTIDGICYVIDSGFCKLNTYDPRTGMESLIVTPASKASAQQRAGRAGRTAPGKCFRLFTKWAFHNELEDNTIPEIQRTNLGNVVLLLKSLGINDLLKFDFMDPPPAETLIRALEHLYALGALNDRGELTKLGRRMAEFPLEPQLSKTILASEEFHCSEQITTIVAMLSVNNAIFYRPKDKAAHADHAMHTFWRPFGDHLTLLNVYDQWVETDYSTQWCFENFIQHRSMVRAHDVRDQLLGLLDRVEIKLRSSSDDQDIRKTVASGFFYHTAKIGKGGSYKTTKHNQSVHIHPSSCLYRERPRWLIYHSLVYTTKEFMRQVLEIKPEWLYEVAPHYYRKEDLIEESSKKKMPKNTGRAVSGSLDL